VSVGSIADALAASSHPRIEPFAQERTAKAVVPGSAQHLAEPAPGPLKWTMSKRPPRPRPLVRQAPAFPPISRRRLPAASGKNKGVKSVVNLAKIAFASSEVLKLFGMSDESLLPSNKRAVSLGIADIRAALPLHHGVFWVMGYTDHPFARWWWRLGLVGSWVVTAQLGYQLHVSTAAHGHFFSPGSDSPAQVMLLTWSTFFSSTRLLYTLRYRPGDAEELLLGLVQTEGHLRVLQRDSRRLALLNICFWALCMLSSIALTVTERCSFLLKAVAPLEAPWARALAMIGYYYLWLPSFFFGGMPYSLSSLVQAHAAELELVIYRKTTYTRQQAVAGIWHFVDLVSPILDYPYANDTHTWVFNSLGLCLSLFSAWYSANTQDTWTFAVSVCYVIAGYTIVLLSWVPYSAVQGMHLALARAALHCTGEAEVTKGWTVSDLLYLERIVLTHPPLFAVGPFEVTAPFVWTYSNVVLFLLILILGARQAAAAPVRRARARFHSVPGSQETLTLREMRKHAPLPCPCARLLSLGLGLRRLVARADLLPNLDIPLITES
jgi:hypothetical protein